MRLSYDTSDLEASCTNAKTIQKRFAKPVASGIMRRIKQIESARTIDDLLNGVGKWHSLTNEGTSVFAGSLSANWRIVVQFRSTDGGVEAHVLEIVDYH